MPTVYRFAKKSLLRNKVNARDLEIWAKHCALKNMDPRKTIPAKHPVKQKKFLVIVV